MAVAEPNVAVCFLLSLGGDGVVIMFLCHLQPSKDLGLGKMRDCNTLSMTEVNACPTDLIHCPEMTPAEAVATPDSGGTERRKKMELSLYSAFMQSSLYAPEEVSCSPAS